MKVYRDYDQMELDRQYNQATLIPDSSHNRNFKTAESERVRGLLDCLIDVPYGLGPDELLDIFPVPLGVVTSVVLYIHGGAWKSGNKRDVSYPAESFVARGVAYIAVNFSLVPDVPLAEQVRQCRAAVAWTFQNAESFGADPKRLYVAGHSSGGHVAGMMAVTDWQAELGLPDDTLKGVVAASGMFDLEPVQLSWRNSYLNIDKNEALRLSPVRHIPPAGNGVPLILIHGGQELDEFQRQSRDMAVAWAAAGHAGDLIVLPEHNHFAVNTTFNEPEGPVLKAAFEMMGV
jgi:arylformamidase